MPETIVKKNWKVRSFDPAVQKPLIQSLNISPIIAQILINRGITQIADAKIFFNADLSFLHDPFLLKDMDKAVARIRLALQRKENILIFGDYDVDGVTSSAILHKALKNFGLTVFNHIPHRMQDGYGLNEGVADYASELKIDLLITVDCGITAIKEVTAINQKGIDVIIIDHHEPSGEGLPPALAIIDPKRKECSYPFKHLASVGLSAKFIQALNGSIEEDLDLVALGTIADVVPLKGENRIFVKAGMPKLSETKNTGLAALMDIAKIKGKKFRPHYAGFVLGPRLNATGRLDSAKVSLDLLLSEEQDQAYALAQSLESMNTERQRLQRAVVQEALQLIEEDSGFHEQRVIVISKEGWHRGVLGIVASKVMEMYYRPTIVISLKEGVGTASARSIEGFHLHQALSHCSNILEAFGGHKLAAGLTIKEENIGQFKGLINDFAKDLLQVRDLVPSIDIDGEIPISSLNLDLAQKIAELEPYGEGNSEPVFCSRQLTVKSRPQVLGKETLKFWVTDGRATFSAVGFGLARFQDLVQYGEKIDLAYQVGIDDWNKAPTVQLKLKDIQVSER